MDTKDQLSELSTALYEESSVKGLDKDLLKLNREMIKQQQIDESTNKFENLPNSPEIRKKPSQKSSQMGRQMFALLVGNAQKEQNLPKLRKRHLFVKDRMVFEFDIRHDFFDPNFKENIPTTVLRGAEDDSEDEKFRINMGNKEFCQRIVKALENVSKNGKKRLQRQSNTITSNFKYSFNKVAEKSDSEDIFDNVGSYVFKPMAELSYRKNSNKKDETSSSNTLEVSKKSKNSKITKSTESKPDKMSDGEKSTHSSRKRRRHRRSHKESRRHDRSSRRHKQQEGRSRYRGGTEVRKESSSNQKMAAIKTVPTPASSLSEAATKNLARRKKLPILKRIEEEIRANNEVVSETTEGVKIGLKRAFREISDPYDLNAAVEYGAGVNEESDDEELQKKAKKSALFSQKTSSKRIFQQKRKSGKAKFEKQWEKIQEKLKGMR